MAQEKEHALVEALRNPTREDGAVSIIPHLKDQCEAKYEVKNEKPWHRVLAYLLMQGKTAVEAAAELEKSPEHVRQVQKQPWFKALVAQLNEAHYESDVSGLLKAGAVESIMTLTELATSAESESVRASSANNLLDKYLRTKPPEKPEAPSDPKAELDQLDEEIRRLEETEEDHGPE